MLLFIGALTVSAGAAALPDPETVWEYRVEGGIKGTPVLFPTVEAPTGVLVNAADGRVILVSGKGAPAWEVDLTPGSEAGDWAEAPPAVGDLDGDGTPEIVAALLTGDVVVLGADGTERWRYPLEGAVTDWSSACLADLNGDGKCEIVIGDQSGWMTCLSGAGERLWRIKVDPYQVSPAAFIRDAGPCPDKIVYGTENDHVVAVSSAGQLLWVAQQVGQFGRTAPTAADLDGDGDYELGVLTSFNNPDSRLWVFDADDGSVAWSAKLNLHGYPAVAMADLEADGSMEVVVANRSNTVYCFNGDGTERWHTYTGGHAICWTPAIADIDGDGQCEVITGTRDANERGKSWFVLDAEGHIKGEFALAGDADMAPLVGDLDQDGRIDIVLASMQAGVLRCVTFGGPTESARIEWASHRRDAARQACVPAKTISQREPMPSVPAELRANWKEPVVWGRNELTVAWPTLGTDRAVIEVAATDPLGRREAHVKDVSPAELPDTLSIDLVGTGKHTVNVRILDPEAANQCTFEHTEQVVLKGFEGFTARVSNHLDSLNTVADALGDKAPSTAQMLRERRARRMGALEQLAERAKETDLSHAPNADTLTRAIVGFTKAVDEDLELARIAVAINETQPGLTFAVWEDPNPWDLTPPLLEGGQPSGTVSIQIPLYLGEYESRCLSLLNLEQKPVCLQVRLPEEVRESIRLYECIETLGRDGDWLPDALAEPNSAHTLHLAPGEARRLWVTLNGRTMAPGMNEIAFEVVSLGGSEDRIPVHIQAEVSTLDIRHAPLYRSCNWSSPARLRQSLTHGKRVIRNAIEHGMNVHVMGAPVPGWKEDGARASADWTEFDADLDLIGPEAFILISGQGIAAPPGTEKFGPEHVAAQHTWLQELADHLASRGFGKDRWALYPVDEPGLYGGTKIKLYEDIARHLKEAMPDVPIYANPSGNITRENMTGMVPLTDVWCPEQALLRRQPDLAEFFLSTGKPVWSYEAPPDSKTQLPLGYYRANAWMAFTLGLHGTGFWTQLYTGSHYGGNDMWFAGKGVLFGANYESSGNEVISRRWEAYRDGLEDVRAFLMLRNAADAARAKGIHAEEVAHADALLSKDVAEATRKAWPCGDPTRFLRDYEMDYAEILRIRAEAETLTQVLLAE